MRIWSCNVRNPTFRAICHGSLQSHGVLALSPFSTGSGLTWLFACALVCNYICARVCICVCVPIHLSVHLSIRLFVHLSICLSLSIIVYLYI